MPPDRAEHVKSVADDQVSLLQQAAQLSHPQLRVEEANLNYRLLKQRLNQADAAAGAREAASGQ